VTTEKEKGGCCCKKVERASGKWENTRMAVPEELKKVWKEMSD